MSLERTQWLNCLPYKNEDQSWVPQKPCKYQVGVVAHLQGRTRHPQSYLAGITSQHQWALSLIKRPCLSE